MDVSKVGPICVAGYDYPVSYETRALIDKKLFAESDHILTKITLRDDTSAQMQLQSLIHEIQHVIEFTYLEGVTIEERLIAGLAQGWFQVFRDNTRLRQAFDELNEECNREDENE